MAGVSGREPLLRSEIHGFITYSGRPLQSERRHFSFSFPPFSVFFSWTADSVAGLRASSFVLSCPRSDSFGLCTSCYHLTPRSPSSRGSSGVAVHAFPHLNPCAHLGANSRCLRFGLPIAVLLGDDFRFPSVLCCCKFRPILSFLVHPILPDFFFYPRNFDLLSTRLCD